MSKISLTSPVGWTCKKSVKTYQVLGKNTNHSKVKTILRQLIQLLSFSLLASSQPNIRPSHASARFTNTKLKRQVPLISSRYRKKAMQSMDKSPTDLTNLSSVSLRRLIPSSRLSVWFSPSFYLQLRLYLLTSLRHLLIYCVTVQKAHYWT
jgi:hypothetical protein